VSRSVDDRALVVVPTYNERDSIEEVVTRLFEAAPDSVDLLVVDDASPDATADVAGKLSGDYPIHVLERSAKLGLGTAYWEGFRWALERRYWAVVEMDADLSHDPADVPRLLAALDNADLVIGSRYVGNGGTLNWGRLRRALSLGGNLYARLWLGWPIKDATSGLRAYRASALERLNPHSGRSEGYAFQIEMARRVYRHGGRVVEVPITFTERAHGRSKMSRRIIVEALWRVSVWGVVDRARTLARRRRCQRSTR
jgi:dolichol-phosphate mannosyltransferase